MTEAPAIEDELSGALWQFAASVILRDIAQHALVQKRDEIYGLRILYLCHTGKYWGQS